MTRDLIERLADAATREIHGDDYRLATRLVIERVVKDYIRSAVETEMPSEPHYFDSDGYRCEQGVKPHFVKKEDYDALLSHSQALTAAKRAAEEERDQLKQLYEAGCKAWNPVLEATANRADAAEQRAAGAEEELARLTAKLQERRPFTFGQDVIDSQVKEIDRLHGVIAADRKDLRSQREATVGWPEECPRWAADAMFNSGASVSMTQVERIWHCLRAAHVASLASERKE